MTAEQIDKLGNTLIYLRQKIGFLSKTKALKLLYFIEETAVKKFGHQILDLDFEVWKHGPVDRTLFEEFSNDDVHLLSQHISVVPFGDNKRKIEAVSDFNDDEFSDDDLRLIDEIIEGYGNKTAGQLSDLTHQKGSPWESRASKKHKIFWLINDSSNEKIDFSELIPKDDIKNILFEGHNDFRTFNSGIKG